jgi:predicted transcriptional regulator
MTSTDIMAAVDLLSTRPDLCLSQKDIVTLTWLLRTDGKITNNELAEAGNMSAKSARKSISRLRHRGLIGAALDDRRVTICQTK